MADHTIRPEEGRVRITIDAVLSPAEVERVVNDIRTAAREAYAWSDAKARAEAEAKSKADAEAKLATMPGGWIVRHNQGGYYPAVVRYTVVTLLPDGTPSASGMSTAVIRSAPPDIWWRIANDRTVHLWRNGERVCNRDYLNDLTRIYGYREGDPSPKWKTCPKCLAIRTAEKTSTACE